jgi:hypothetical protein
MITSTPLSTMTTTSYKSSPGLDFNADIYVTNLMKAGNIADYEIGMDLNSLLHHWIHQGLDRPILASTVDSRKSFLSLIDTNVSRLLEIGPFFNPAFKCNDGSIKYADLLSTEQLIERAQAIGGATDSVPNIDYIYKDGGINTSSDTSSTFWICWKMMVNISLSCQITASALTAI